MAAILQNIHTTKVNYEKVSVLFFICLIGLVLTAYFCQVLLTRAIYLKKPSYIMPFGYVTIILSFIIDTLLFD